LYLFIAFNSFFCFYVHFKMFAGNILSPPTLFAARFYGFLQKKRKQIMNGRCRALSFLSPVLSNFTLFQFTHCYCFSTIKSLRKMNVGVFGDLSNVNLKQFTQLLNNKRESATIFLFAPLDSLQKTIVQDDNGVYLPLIIAENRQQKIINCGTFPRECLKTSFFLLIAIIHWGTKISLA
jgi:hypothetical protein